jgi:hypothetical protein
MALIDAAQNWIARDEQKAREQANTLKEETANV